MDLRQLNDYALVTVYARQTLYDQLFSKTEAIRDGTTESLRSCRKQETGEKHIQNVSGCTMKHFKMQTQVHQL